MMKVDQLYFSTSFFININSFPDVGLGHHALWENRGGAIPNIGNIYRI